MNSLHYLVNISMTFGIEEYMNLISNKVKVECLHMCQYCGKFVTTNISNVIPSESLEITCAHCGSDMFYADLNQLLKECVNTKFISDD